MSALDNGSPWLASDVTVPEPDAHCESCGGALYAGFDEWQELPAQDGDGETTYTICAECVEAQLEAGLQLLAEDPAWQQFARRVAETPIP